MSDGYDMSGPEKVFLFIEKNPLEENVIRATYLNAKSQPRCYRDFSFSNTLLSAPGIEEAFTKKIALDAIDNMVPRIIITHSRKITFSEEKILRGLDDKLSPSGFRILDIIYKDNEYGYITSWRREGHVGEVVDDAKLPKSGKNLVSSFTEGFWNEKGELDNSIGKNYESLIESTTATSYDFMSKEDVAKLSRHFDEVSHSDVEVGTVAGFKEGRLVGLVEVAKGGINSCFVDKIVLFKRVREMKADGFMFLHNHPSGSPAPSKEDVLMALQLSSTSEMLGISYIDSAIVGGKNLSTNIGGIQNTYEYKSKTPNPAFQPPTKNEKKPVNKLICN